MQADSASNEMDLYPSQMGSLFSLGACPIPRLQDRAAAVSAIFTFVRFDLERLDGLREVFKSLVRAHRENATGELGIALLSECYATWKELESTPEESLGFMINWLLTQRFIQPRSVDEFKATVPREVWAKIDPQLENLKR